MAAIKTGSITVYYSPPRTETSVAQDIAETFDRVQGFDIVYGPRFRNVRFELMKRSNEIGYQITFFDISIFDEFLDYIRDVKKELQKKYKISIVFLSIDGKATEFSNKHYWKSLFMSIITRLLAIPPVVIFCFWIGGLISSWLSSVIGNEIVMNIINELLPLITCYPIGVMSIAIMPNILKVRVLSLSIVLITAFLYYFFTGNGLIGSCLLLLAFILKSIQNSLT